MSQWTLFSNHGHVLVVLSRDANARLRDVAIEVGITERAVQKIVRDLQDVGMLSVSKQGRRNCYTLHGSQPLRHALEEHCTVGQLMALVNADLDPAQPSVHQEAAAAGNASSLPVEELSDAQVAVETVGGLESVTFAEASPSATLATDDSGPGSEAPVSPAGHAKALEQVPDAGQGLEERAVTEKEPALPDDAGDQGSLF